MVHFIRACAVLHNLSIEDDFVFQEEMYEHPINRPLDNDVLEEEVPDDQAGVAKRIEIMNSLPFRI